MIQGWRLDTDIQTLVLASDTQRLPSVVYWGSRLPDNEDLQMLAKAHLIDVTGGMLDQNPDLSICPEATQSFPGQLGLRVSDRNTTPIYSKFCLEDTQQTDCSLILTFRCLDHGLQYQACFTAFRQSNVITAQASLSADEAIRLHWFAAPVMPAPSLASEMIDFSGRWCGEFQEVRTPWNAGMRYRENRTGRTGHEHFPALIIPEHGATNTVGKAYGFHYGWSGGHTMIAEELADGRRQIQFGHATHTEHQAARTFHTAPLYLTYSPHGINGIARSFQRHLRHHIVQFPEVNRPRPVHYNCWEAVYFDHNVSELQQIATLAARLGAERFVLDDGWFGTRNDDTRALSEWKVDPRKYPDGLTPLIEHVHAEGMLFGIWFEPEMINPQSRIYNTHPQWSLGSEDQILGRHQKVLDMALPEVRDFLYNRISAILGEYAIDYIKWDHNRVLPMPDVEQTRGAYLLIERLRTAFPDIEIESCASGGGRIDFGMLSRTHRVWLSDSNDALERARIQHHAALFLPACVTGSHVGPRHCHTSGRMHDIHFRAWIAAQRHLGFELDPRELTEQETAILTKITRWWKQERHWMMNADILRLDSLDPAVLAEQHLSDDQQQFLIFANKIDSSGPIVPRPLRACALDPNAHYDMTLINRDEVPKLSRGKPHLKFDNIRASGAYLMNQGITLPWSFAHHVWVIKGQKQ